MPCDVQCTRDSFLDSCVDLPVVSHATVSQGHPFYAIVLAARRSFLDCSDAFSLTTRAALPLVLSSSLPRTIPLISSSLYTPLFFFSTLFPPLIYVRRSTSSPQSCRVRTPAHVPRPPLILRPLLIVALRQHLPRRPPIGPKSSSSTCRRASHLANQIGKHGSETVQQWGECFFERFYEYELLLAIVLTVHTVSSYNMQK